MDTKSKTFTNLLYFIIGITLLAIVICIFTYFKYLGGGNISTSPEAWAQLGDYMGGILNPLLAIINICVFVLLTLVIQRATDKNNDDAVESSKRIAIMTMKHEELNHFKSEMDKSLSECHSLPLTNEQAQSLLTTYNVLEYRMLFLFPELNELKSNKDLRKYIVENLNSTKSNEHTSSSHLIPVSNMYGMLVSDLSELVVA